MDFLRIRQLCVALAVTFASECLWLFIGACTGFAGVFAPFLPRLFVRLARRALGIKTAPLWPVAYQLPLQLLFAVPLASTTSGMTYGCSLICGHSFRLRLFLSVLSNVVVFSGLACWSFLRFSYPRQSSAKLNTASKAQESAVASNESPRDIAGEGKATVIRSVHRLKVDGRDVQLRVFVPTAPAEGEAPAVVMVCGLLWLGEGLLGQIGITFNDSFGYAFARAGASCVQIHTPARHIGHTKLVDIQMLVMLVLGFALFLVPGLRYVLLAADVLMLATSTADLWMLVFVVILPGILDILLAFFSVPLILLGPLGLAIALPHFLSGLLVLPLLHIAARGIQYKLLGELPGPERRDYLKEVDAATAWAVENQKLLRNDGRLVLCGYSSGGHVAALHGLKKCTSQLPAGGRGSFEAVVLISGIYDLRTSSWLGLKRYLAPIFNLMYSEILGLTNDDARAVTSPVAVAQDAKQPRLDGRCHWHILCAKKELMGLQPVEDILFQAGPFHAALEAKGAVVKRYVCGYNHWLLVFNVEDFVTPFVKSLSKRDAAVVSHVNGK